MADILVARKVSPGMVFDQVTVLRSTGHFMASGHKREKFWVRCSCGNEYEIPGYCIARGEHKHCQKCSNKARRTVNIGDRFDAAVVLGFTEVKGREMAECRCDCGTVYCVRAHLLPKNKTNNCGCGPRGLWKGTGEMPYTYYHRVQRGAQTRNLVFSVTPEYLWGLYQTQGGLCAVTGLPIPFNRKVFNPCTASLDRIDSTQGYVEGNVQWVHKDINRMKMDLPMDRFVELCQLVVSHRA